MLSHELNIDPRQRDLHNQTPPNQRRLAHNLRPARVLPKTLSLVLTYHGRAKSNNLSFEFSSYYAMKGSL